MDKPYVLIDNDVPDFSDVISTMDLNEPFEIYSPLDNKDRCQVALANVCLETMPTEPRTSISSIKPTGWQEDYFLDKETGKTKKLYNRCHLIAYSLTAENMNIKKLITGTNYINNSGMRVFENKVKNFIDNNSGDNPHVLYRVTPIFSGDELLCRGVHMEAMSYGASEEQLQFNVYVYNVQKGVEIDYSTGKIIE